MWQQLWNEKGPGEEKRKSEKKIRDEVAEREEFESDLTIKLTHHRLFAT